MREYAEAVADCVQVPFELPIAHVLGVLAIAATKRFEVRITEEHREPVNIWTVCPLPSGERKSSTLNLCKAPLERFEDELQKAHIPIAKEARAEARAIEELVRTRHRDLAKAKSQSDKDRIIEELKGLEVRMPEVPPMPALLAEDITAEALCSILEDNGERIGFLAAEGGLFEVLGGRYTKGKPNLGSSGSSVLRFVNAHYAKLEELLVSESVG